MLTRKSEFLLKQGQVIWVNYYNYPNGAVWVVKYKGNYYKVIHDGTGNGFFHSGEPEKISEKTAKKLVAEAKSWETARELGWWTETEEDFWASQF